MRCGARNPVIGDGSLNSGALLGIALLAGFVPRWQQQQESAAQQSAADTKRLAVQNVAVVSPQLVTPKSELDLPAEVKPWQEASIYSRVNRNSPRAFSKGRSNLNNSGLG